LKWERLLFVNEDFYQNQTGSVVHPASYAIGTGGSFPELKRPGSEADHSPSSSAEVKNVWRYTSTPWRGAWLSTGKFYLYQFSQLFNEVGTGN
jgi:hypothetical protein